jgi:hypothetical protein
MGFSPGAILSSRRSSVNAVLVRRSGVVVPDVGAAVGIQIDHVIVLRVAVIVSNGDDVALAVFLDHDAGHLIAGCA